MIKHSFWLIVVLLVFDGFSQSSSSDILPSASTIEQQGIENAKYPDKKNNNWFTGTFSVLSWKQIKKEYHEPNLQKQKPGDVIEMPCEKIRPDNFNRIHNFMTLGIARCGFVTTYANHKKPNPQELVHIFFIKFSSFSSSIKKNPSPLVFLTGGPGQANTSLPVGSEHIIDTFREQRDYLLIDYRGTGMSLPSLACLKEMMQLYLHTGVYGHNQKEAKYIRACRKNLVQNGVHTELFHTSSIATDIKKVLIALGYKKADFQSVSYGTKVGLTIMREYPEIVRSMVLDSVYPIEVDGFGETTTTIFDPLDKMVDACIRSPSCNHQKFISEMEKFLTRIANLTTKHNQDKSRGTYTFVDILKILSLKEFLLSSWPVELSFLNQLNDDDLNSFILNRLVGGTSKYEVMQQYFGEDLGNLNDLQGPGKKDGVPMLALSLLDEFVGFWHSINCQEEVISPNLKKLTPFSPPYHSRYFSPQIVKMLSNFVTEYLNDLKTRSCESWEIKKANNNLFNNQKEHIPVKSSIPVLLLSARMDFFTPLTWAKQVKLNLSTSHWYISETGSHDVVSSDPCALSVMINFLNDPRNFITQNKREPTTSCVRYKRPLRYEMK